MRLSPRALIVGLSMVLPAGLAQPALAQKDPESTMAKSLEVLSEITRNPKTGMPRLVMKQAQGIAVIPDMFKMSFIFGARFGRGVLSVRQPDGTWSNPVFIHLMGGSFGAQAGAQSTNLVLVFQTQKGLDRFLKAKDKLTLGVDVGVAAGPVGKRFEASTDAGLKSEILSYSNTRGIFAGVSAEGGSLQIDWKANTLYYGQPVSPAAVLAVNSPLDVPSSTISLKQLLAEKTALPERIVRTRRPRSEPVVVEEDSPIFDDQDGVEIDGALSAQPGTRATTEPPRTSPRRQARPQAEPADDDLDAIPPPASRRKSPGQARPQPPNDEDLPEAIPGPVPSPAKAKRKPQPQPPPSDDDDPQLEAPRSARAGSLPS